MAAYMLPQSPAPRRSRARLLIAAAAFGAAALFQGSTTFAAPGQSALQVSRRQALRTSRVALSARGGADEDDDFDFDFPVDVNTLKPGDELEGVVTKVLKFGAFVDIGADNNQEGLVPTSKLADGRVENTEDVVKVGDTVKVWVVEMKGNKLTLSMSKKKINPPPKRGPPQVQADVTLFEPLVGGDFVDGKVVAVQPFGAFVTINPPNGEEGTGQGLVHITQIKAGFVDKVEDEVSVGQDVKVRVLSVDTEKGKIALSMKSADAGGAPPQKKGPKNVEAFNSMSDEEWLTGKVKSIAKFGAFVEVSSGDSTVDGLVHISQIQEGFLEDPAEVLEVGQDVKVRVIEVDTDKGKLGLSMKEKVVAAEAAETAEA